MHLVPEKTEEFSTALTPADIFRRLGYRTAPATLTTVGGLLAFRAVTYEPMHYFLGALSPTGFTLQRLTQATGQGRFTDFTTALRTSATGEAHPTANGARLVLRYYLTPLSGPAIGLGLLALAYSSWAAQRAPGYALLQFGILTGVSWLGIQAFFRSEVRSLRSQLIELLQLVPVALA